MLFPTHSLPTQVSIHVRSDPAQLTIIVSADVRRRSVLSSPGTGTGSAQPSTATDRQQFASISNRLFLFQLLRKKACNTLR
jgi:hypothetical protein